MEEVWCSVVVGVGIGGWGGRGLAGLGGRRGRGERSAVGAGGYESRCRGRY
jgi:hypothetical protein